MLTMFNRKELIITFSMNQQAKVRNLLAANNIDYTIKTLNRKSPSPLEAGSRSRSGTIGESLDLAYEYKIYVHKNDYQQAILLTNNINFRH